MSHRESINTAVAASAIEDTNPYAGDDDLEMMERFHKKFPADVRIVADDERKQYRAPGIVLPPPASVSQHRQWREPRKIFLQPTVENTPRIVNEFKENAEKRKLINTFKAQRSFLKLPTAGQTEAHFLNGTGNGAHNTGFYDFSEVVDEDTTQAYENYISSVLAGKLVESAPFRAVVLVAILLNTLLVGLQTSVVLERKYSDVIEGFDKSFLTIFTLEIVLKWYNNFWTFWYSGWNVFDFLLVFISIIGDGLDFLTTGRVLRIFRVLRAFRSLRSISALQGLQMVVTIIVRSIPDMANIIALLLIVNFIFSVIAVDMLGEQVPEHMGTIPKSMFSLFVMMTQDGWVDIYRDMEDNGVAISGAIFTMVYIIVGAFIFANIFVGSLVTNLTISVNENKMRSKIKHHKLENAHKTDGKVHRQNETVAMMSGKLDPALWKLQKPHKVPDFRRFSLEQLENYYLVLVAIEDNLAEQIELKETIETILSKMKTLNHIDDDDVSGVFSDNDYDEGAEGDIPATDALSKMIAMEKLMALEQAKRDIQVARGRKRESIAYRGRKAAALASRPAAVHLKKFTQQLDKKTGYKGAGGGGGVKLTSNTTGVNNSLASFASHSPQTRMRTSLFINVEDSSGAQTGYSMVPLVVERPGGGGGVEGKQTLKAVREYRRKSSAQTAPDNIAPEKWKALQRMKMRRGSQERQERRANSMVLNPNNIPRSPTRSPTRNSRGGLRKHLSMSPRKKRGPSLNFAEPD